MHSNGILKNTTVPALVNRNHLTDAVILTANILNSLDYIGVLGVELFVSSEGLVVNEIAPRVHNSGHWTQNGCLIDQFEQHIRAISGWTLGDGSRHSDIKMENIIGDAIEEISLISRDPEISVHLYGKSETRPGRKMGHTNKILKKN
jgi:5-(carboxyamino)imidazole ribonucleotide synthase